MIPIGTERRESWAVSPTLYPEYLYWSGLHNIMLKKMSKKKKLLAQDNLGESTLARPSAGTLLEGRVRLSPALNHETAKRYRTP